MWAAVCACDSDGNPRAGHASARRRRAAELGWSVSQWCYRETLEPHGWLTEDQVTRKRGELSPTMWAVEYELRCFRHQLLLPRPYLVLTKPLRLDIQSQRGASVKIGWKYLDD